jgi:phenylpyruvate tautomerase PptA (4-oxalocrotonate tautomerase family)
MAANVDWASSAEEQEKKLITKVSDVSVQHGTEYCASF